MHQANHQTGRQTATKQQSDRQKAKTNKISQKQPNRQTADIEKQAINQTD